MDNILKIASISLCICGIISLIIGIHFMNQEAIICGVICIILDGVCIIAYRFIPVTPKLCETSTLSVVSVQTWNDLPIRTIN
jgi:hypothetical protein